MEKKMRMKSKKIIDDDRHVLLTSTQHQRRFHQSALSLCIGPMPPIPLKRLIKNQSLDGGGRPVCVTKR